VDEQKWGSAKAAENLFYSHPVPFFPHSDQAPHNIFHLPLINFQLRRII
jgi:hypothetical protein